MVDLRYQARLLCLCRYQRSRAFPNSTSVTSVAPFRDFVNVRVPAAAESGHVVAVEGDRSSVLDLALGLEVVLADHCCWTSEGRTATTADYHLSLEEHCGQGVVGYEMEAHAEEGFHYFSEAGWTTGQGWPCWKKGRLVVA